MSRIYSTRFASLVATATSTSVFVVPDGKVAVLKHMSMGFNNPARAVSLFQVLLSGSNSRFWVVNIPTAQQGDFQWTGYAVLPAAEYLRINVTGGASAWFTASGYLFDV